MELSELLATLEGRFALGLKPAERERLAALPPPERRAPLLELAGEAARRALWIQAALWLEKSDHDPELGMLLAAALSEPGPLPPLKAGARFAEAYRESFARAFGMRFEGANLAPLYVRKYVGLVDEIVRLCGAVEGPEGDADAVALDERLPDLIHFLGSTFTAGVVQARQNPAGTMQARALLGSPVETGRSLRGVGAVAGGVYLIHPDGEATSLHPFFLAGARTAPGERVKAWIFEGYRDGRLDYRALPGDTPRAAEPELNAHWALLFTRLGSLHRAWVLLEELPIEDRALSQLHAAVGHALKARQLRAAGQHGRAAAELELAIRARVDIPTFHFLAVEAVVAAGDLQRAVAVCNRLLEQFPASERGYLGFAEVLEKRGELPKALRAYDKVLAINPHSPEGLRRRKRAEERLRAGESDRPAADAGAPAQPGAESGRPLVREFLTDLSALAETGKLPGRLGGEAPLGQLIEILSCKERNSALILGDPGVGKSSLVEGLAVRLLHGDAPPKLRGRRLLLMSVATLVAGAKFRGQFEERVLALIEEIKRQEAILVIDHLHTLLAGGGARGGSFDAATLLKPALSRSEIQVIGLSGHEDFSAVIEKDPALMRALQIIRLQEPPPREARAIAAYCAPRYEEFHGVHFTRDAVREAVVLAKLSLRERALPDSALQLLDRAAAAAAIAGEREVTRAGVTAAVAALTGISADKLRLGAGARLARLEARLRKRVRGQDAALASVARVLRTTRMGFKTHPRRPEGVFLFAGPTGVGKTELSRAIAAALLGSEERLIRIDMSEYMERINAARLIGTAPGYVGYNDPNQLTDQVRKNPFSVVLFDEIEKADAAVLNLFLQIFDAGRLTDGRGRAVSFNHATVIMTSNVGTHLFARKRLGLDNAPRRVTREAMQKEIRGHFPAEFLNRVDEIVFFDPLEKSAIREIIELQLEPVRRRLRSDGKALELTAAAADWLAQRGYSFEYGARNLSRVIRRELLDPLAERAVQPGWRAIRAVQVDARDGALHLAWLTGPEAEPAVLLAEAEAERPGE